MQDTWDPWVGKIPWKRKWQPTPVFLPRKSHGQRSLAGYSPGGHRVGYDLVTKEQQEAWIYLNRGIFLAIPNLPASSIQETDLISMP